jgi:hypothetical protein
MPTPLDDEETDFGGRTAPTMPPSGRGYGGGGRGNADEGVTEIPRARGGRGVLDFGEEEETALPNRRGRDDDDIDKTELIEQPTGTECMLWVKDGPRRGKFYGVKHGTVVGRKEGALLLEDPKVSARHAKFTVEDDDFVVWDLASGNGTYVNDKKIRGATTLNENDTIKIGETLFVVKFLEPKVKKKSSGKKSKPAEDSDE